MTAPLLQLLVASRLRAIATALTLTTIAAVSAPYSAYSAQLARWRFNPDNRQLEIITTTAAQPNYFILAEPPRIVVDLPNTTLGPVVEEQRYSGPVRHIRVSQFQPTLTRIVIELDTAVELAPQQVQISPSIQSTGWVIRPLLAGEGPSIVAESPEPTGRAAAAVGPAGGPVAERLDAERAEQSSPGNFGLEPGAIALTVETATEPRSGAARPVTNRPAPPERSTEDPVEELSNRDRPAATLNTVTLVPDAITITAPSGPSADEELEGAVPLPVSPALGDTGTDTDDSDNTDEELFPDELGADESPLGAPAADVPAAEARPDVAVTSDSAPAPDNDDEADRLNEEADEAIALLPRTPSGLPVGTTLQLRYPRSTPLTLAAGESRQEVLLIAEAIQDRAGNTILPAGTPVIGRFEVADGIGRFVAQALVSPEGNQPLSGTVVIETAVPEDNPSLDVAANQILELPLAASELP